LGPLRRAPPKVTCADLPGARRLALQASQDGKTLYYIEEATKKLDDERVVTLNLYALDVATRAAKLVVSDVESDAVVLADGTAVFRRQTEKKDILGRHNHKLMIARPNQEAVAITDEKNEVGEFEVDAAKGTVYMVMGESSFPSELWKVPLAGGAPEKIKTERVMRIYGLVDDALIVPNYGGGLTKQPTAGGAATELANIYGSYLLGIHAGHLVLQDKASEKVTIAPLADAKKQTALDVGSTDVSLFQARDQSYLLAKKPGTYEVHALTGTATKPVLVAKGARPSAAIAIGDKLAVLAIVDSDGNGDHEYGEEADVCFVSPGPDVVELPSRTIPKRFVEVAKRLAAVTKEGPLAGASLRFTTDGPLEFVEFTVASGTSDLDKLRELAKSTQEKVTQHSGLAQLSVAIAIRDNGRRAVSRWDAPAGAFLTSAGMGTAQVVDRREYKVEVDPAITLTRESDRYGMNRESRIGTVTCSGSITNISDKELANLEAECTNELHENFGDGKPAKGKVKPPKLAPNATGKYSVELGVADAAKGVPLTLYSDGARIAYLNAFANKRAESVLAVAAKVHDQTKLAYYSMVPAMIGPSYSRKKVVKIYVRGDKAFADGSKEARQTAAAAALPLFAEYTTATKNLEGDPMLLVLRGDGFEVGWTYANGTLTDGEPRSD
jgi:hypothetical protein